LFPNLFIYLSSSLLTLRKIFEAGTDVDCGGFVSQFAPSALSKGLITWKDIDRRLAELFKVRMRLGHFDPISPV
jgi:pre-mRNA-splicing factor SYF2/beta-D-xylosidase 4